MPCGNIFPIPAWDYPTTTPRVTSPFSPQHAPRTIWNNRIRQCLFVPPSYVCTAYARYEYSATVVKAQYRDEFCCRRQYCGTTPDSLMKLKCLSEAYVSREITILAYHTPNDFPQNNCSCLMLL